jgi:Toprim-like
LRIFGEDTLYAATGGGMGPGTIAALEALLVNIAMLPGALFCSATDANGPGDRFADRHRSLAREFGVAFARLRPPIEGGDWNEVLHAQSEAISRRKAECLKRSSRPSRSCG